MNKTIFNGNDNPIFSFISPPQNQLQKENFSSITPVLQTEPAFERRVNKKKEDNGRKTKRFNLLIQPALHETLAKIACIKQTSVNAIIVEASKEYCEKEVRALEKYDRTFGKEVEEV